MTIRDKDYTRVLLDSSYTTITGWAVLLTYSLGKRTLRARHGLWSGSGIHVRVSGFQTQNDVQHREKEGMQNTRAA